MNCADSLGPSKILESLREFHAEGPVAWKPAGLIERLAAECQTFSQA